MSEPSPLLHSAFYRFVALHDPVAAADALRALARGLTGSIVVAREGVNGTVAGASDVVAAFEAALQTALAGALRGMVFKHSACSTAPFGRLKVGVKPEIVALGLPEAPSAPDERDASHLSPPAWRELLARDDVVLLDNRNHFEVRLGRFRGALDPQVHNFRDFVGYVQAHAPEWRAANRPVAMYCTGGILNYFGQLPDAARDWQGECFVFDNRVALDTGLRETATTADQVFDASHPDEAWRLQRARRLDGAAD